ncbi:MAG: hypothetical protein PHW73_00125 [Atribacterota bacterium]|nr:hypothetical protein [Atribacterota bacterium]
MEKLEFMFNNQDEIDFLMSHINSGTCVLEWGSGGSTIGIAEDAKHIWSIEHNEGWFNRVQSEIIEESDPWEIEMLSKKENYSLFKKSNIDLYLINRNSEEALGGDGTLENYFDYVNFPLKVGQKFHIILIDGRARVECAKVAVKLLNPGGFIFIHDYAHPQPEYRRYEYEVVEEFLEKVGQVFALAKFKPRIK